MEKIIALIQKYAMKAQSGLSGIQATLISLFIEYVVNHIKKLWKSREFNDQAEEKLQKYKEEIEKPEQTIEERRASDRDFLG